MYWVVKRDKAYFGSFGLKEGFWLNRSIAEKFDSREGAKERAKYEGGCVRVVRVRTKEDLRREREALRAALNEAALTCLGMAKIADVRKSGSDIVEAAFPKVDEWLALARGATPPPSKPAPLTVTCARCGGDGRNPESDRACADCGGLGTVKRAGGADVTSKPAAPVASKPVCSTCNDTHVMPATGWMCTHCPRPCERCRRGANGVLGPYCSRTPCPCACHRAGAGAAETRASTKETTR